MKIHCRQCGAPLDQGLTCAERLYQLICELCIEQRPEQQQRAMASFALSHPQTYSVSALAEARDALADAAEIDESPPRTGCKIFSFAHPGDRARR